jgi:dolichol-phosphate mannosyltransferase
MNPYLVIIPTYNEIENIDAMIHRVMGLEKKIDLLIVDDNSPDGTAEVVKSLQNTYPNQLHLLQRADKNGLGTAYIAGFHWALERPYEYICEMDCDFSHPVDQLPNLFEKCEQGADVCVGSRYYGGVVNVVNWPMGRVLMSYYASKYVQFVTGLNIADTTAGFVCYKREVLEKIGIDEIGNTANRFHFSAVGFLGNFRFLGFSQRTSQIHHSHLGDLLNKGIGNSACRPKFIRRCIHEIFGL